MSDLSAEALAKAESNADFFRVVIPGRECNERALMCNCTSENPFLRRVCGAMDSGFDAELVIGPRLRGPVGAAPE